VQFSNDQRRWLWDEHAIRSDICITSNVLFLLTTKINHLTSGAVQVLKGLSTFGIFVPNELMEILSCTRQYADIRDYLTLLLRDSFLLQVEGGYKFAHDKIHEASYALINDIEKDEFHENLSRQLLTVLNNRQITDNVLPIITDQLNKGLVSRTGCFQIAKLNCRAGSISSRRGEYYSAFSYFNQAVGLLPKDLLEREHELSLNLYYLLAKSAQAIGKSGKACETAQKMLKLGRSMEDKLPAYGLLVMVSLSREMADNAYKISLDVLSQLGENFTEYCDKNDLPTLVSKTTQAITESKQKLKVQAEGGKTSTRISSLLKFYGYLSMASYFVKPQAVPFVCCKMMEITLKHGTNPRGHMALISFSSILCQSSSDLLKNIDKACEIGKLGIDMLETQYNPAEVLDVRAQSVLVYYGLLAPFTLPLQTCASKLKAGLRTGISSGALNSAFMCTVQQIRLSILAGSNLGDLLHGKK